MFVKTKLAIAAAILAGTISSGWADGPEDKAADAIRNYGPVAQQPVVMTVARRSPARSTGYAADYRGFSKEEKAWFDRASQSTN